MTTTTVAVCNPSPSGQLCDGPETHTEGAGLTWHHHSTRHGLFRTYWTDRGDVRVLADEQWTPPTVEQLAAHDETLARGRGVWSTPRGPRRERDGDLIGADGLAVTRDDYRDLL